MNKKEKIDNNIKWMEDILPERVDETAPKVIVDMLMYPYQIFGFRYANKTKTLLDIACGNNIQLPIIKPLYKNVISMDLESDLPNVVHGDILNIPLQDNSVDIAFSYHTIEHTNDYDKVVSELCRVSREIVVIGAPSKDGPWYLDEHVIFKGHLNPFHLKELTYLEWKEYFKNNSIYSLIYDNRIWSMVPGVSKNGICVFAVIKL